MDCLRTLSLRVYRALLILYPAGHREAYGHLMVACFDEMWEEAAASGRLFPLICLWWRTLFDLAESALVEHVGGQRRWLMSRQLWFLWILVSVVSWMTAWIVAFTPAFWPMISGGGALLIGGAVVSGLHTLLLQRYVAPAGWWKRSLPLMAASWLVPALLLPMTAGGPATQYVPWARLSGLPVVLLLVGLASISALLGGIIQSVALRSLLHRPLRWAIVPGVAALISLGLFAALNATLLPLTANLVQTGTFSVALRSGIIAPGLVERTGILFPLLHVLVAIAATGIYGLVTGAAFVALADDSGRPAVGLA